MHFVDHHGLHRGKHRSEVLPAEHQLERFGSGYEQVWRVSRLLRPLRLCRVPVSDVHAQTNGLGKLLQSTVDVSIERTKWGDVEDGEGSPILGKAPVEQRKNPRHGLSRPCGSDDEAVMSFCNLRKGVLLNGGRFPPTLLECTAQRRVKSGKRARHTLPTLVEDAHAHSI